MDEKLIEYINNIKVNNIKVNRRFTNLEIDFNYKLDVDGIIKSFIEDNKLDYDYDYDKIKEIDELYITNSSFESKNLDKIVDDFHIDGHIPNIFGIKTYRLLILLQKDKFDKSETVFKNQKNNDNNNYIIFDYNTQVHKANIVDDKRVKK